MGRVSGRMMVVGFLLVAGLATAAESKPAEKKKKTFTVRTKPLKIEISLSGVFEAEKMWPISLAPKAWPKLKVTWAIEPGAAVKKGDVLLKLETKDIDKQIRDREAGHALALLKLKQAEEELRLQERTTPEQLASAQRKKKIAQEEYDKYQKQDRPFKAQRLELSKGWARVRLEMADIELRELKRMYEADDLIEITEGLILQRQELRTASAHIEWKRNQLQHAWREKLGIPREIEDQELKLQRARTAHDQAETLLPLALGRKGLEVAQMKYHQNKSDQSLADLKADRAAMIVRAPADGLVYYGRCVRGHWPSAGAVAPKLRPGGQLAPHQVFITLVQPAALFVRAKAEEKHLRDLKAGLAARIIPTGYPKPKLNGRVESVRIAPSGPGKYVVTTSIRDQVGPVLPGMTCKVRLVVYEKEKAITVPVKAVFSEELDEDQRFVYVRTAEAKPVKRPVTVGRQKGDHLEIVEGLADGEVILLKKPEK